MAPSLVFAAVFCVAAVGSSLLEVAATSVPAIFVFGDSLVDVGNNNDLHVPLTVKANFPLNGIDFPGGVPTGRFSNGYNLIDWLAKFVGHKQSPPAFASITNITRMLNGVNFASGASGVLDSTGPTITFTEQIASFKQVVEVLFMQIGQEMATELLSKSLFFISSGINDVSAYYSTTGPRNATLDELFITMLIDKFSDHLKVLYIHGARKFGILGMGQIGCVPALRAQSPAGKCEEELNRLARRFNTAAKPRMRSLMRMLQGMKYSYGNPYVLMTLALENPKLFGYEDTESACCGSGRFNGESLCTENATLCLDRNKYLFWDHYHPSQSTSKLTAIKLYSGTRRFAAPINLKTLAKY